mmetsp:Transcript_30816/g.35571  ORF Transcript_30816/g.35571 Transcript_30816/m.35571 type:complete len:144 (+) Transcript_30816:299-730(+)
MTATVAWNECLASLDLWHSRSASRVRSATTSCLLKPTLLVSSIFATLFSYVCFGQLVKWMLRKERKRWNPLAYLIILIQNFYDGFLAVVNADRSQDLAEKDSFGAAAFFIGFILFSLFVTSVIVGLLLQSVVLPLVKKCCCCC